MHPTIYTSGHCSIVTSSHLSISVTIYNLTITVINDNMICEIKADLMNITKMKDLGERHWLLNLKIKQNRTSKLISFSQEVYIDKMISQFHLENSKTHTVQ